MNAIVLRFVEIAFLTRGPEHLPRATFLVFFAASLHFAIAMLSALLLPQNLVAVGVAELLYFFTIYVCVWLLLGLAEHSERGNQTLSAMFGAQAVIEAIRLPVMLFVMVSGESGTVTPLSLVALVAFLFWSIAVMAGIVRRAAGVSKVTALGVAIVYSLTYFSILVALIPPQVR